MPFKLNSTDFHRTAIQNSHHQRIKGQALHKKHQFWRFFLILVLFPTILHAIPGYVEPWGKDADLHYSPPLSLTEDKPTYSLAVQTAIQIIRFHQNVLSPVDGPRSHFRPSSSQYMLLAMQKHGFILGFLMGCDRLIRENDDDWVYRKIETEGKIFKYDPIK